MHPVENAKREADLANLEAVIAIFEQLKSGESQNAYGGKLAKVGGGLWMALRFPDGLHRAVIRLYRTRSDARRYLKEGAMMFDVLHFVEIYGGRDSRGIVSVVPTGVPGTNGTAAGFFAPALASFAVASKLTVSSRSRLAANA
jgi:hypothetical protein